MKFCSPTLARAKPLGQPGRAFPAQSAQAHCSKSGLNGNQVWFKWKPAQGLYSTPTPCPGWGRHISFCAVYSFEQIVSFVTHSRPLVANICSHSEGHGACWGGTVSAAGGHPGLARHTWDRGALEQTQLTAPGPCRVPAWSLAPALTRRPLPYSAEARAGEERAAGTSLSRGADKQREKRLSTLTPSASAATAGPSIRGRAQGSWKQALHSQTCSLLGKFSLPKLVSPMKNRDMLGCGL